VDECERCGENEIHKECGVPRGYEKLCNERYPLIPSPPPICVEGCYCKEGYVRTSDEENICILKSRCMDCQRNQHFLLRGNLCQRTCENFSDEWVTCPPVILPNCMCNEGFIRVSDFNQSCILPQNC
jgi:hypothetical protein